jgi:nucleoside-diphosphate-sugar epimerase
MQPVAITGVTGFIGRHVARTLMREGRPWRGLVRDRRKLAALGLGHGEIVEGHLEDERSLDRLCDGALAAVHCGGSIAGFSRKDFFRINAAGTLAVLGACQRTGVKRFVHVSSLAAREPQLSGYAASKRESETVLELNGGEISWVIVRPPAVYGPGDEATIPLMKALTRSVVFLPGDAASALSLIHVEDLARALTVLALTDSLKGATIEIDDGKTGGYDFAGIAAAASAITGQKTRVVFLPRSMLILPAWCSLILGWLKGTPGVFSPGKLGELYHRNWVVNPHCSELPGWRPQIDFSTGFADTLKWYRENGWLPEGHIRPETDRANQRGALRL